MSKRLRVRYPLFLSNFNETWNFLDRVSKKVQISSFIKICPVGAELFHADRQTDMTKLIVAFRNFANAPKKTLTLFRTKKNRLGSHKVWSCRNGLSTDRVQTDTEVNDEVQTDSTTESTTNADNSSSRRTRQILVR
jgi:hypothetical protein